jgi:predicted TIM-barrel fold metal-dependent hydrolase
MTGERPVIISCDGHAAGRPEDYVSYIDPDYRDQYEEWAGLLVKRREAQAAATENDKGLFSKQGTDDFKMKTGDGRDGEWNSPLRTRVLEDDGVVAEVLFPNPGVPFGAFGESAEHELRGVGNRAYDRWLLDFANDAPGRRAALAMLAVHDVEACVAEIDWAANSGMKGVVIPNAPGEGLAPWYDERYDPIWAACQDLELPVHIHAGGSTPDYGDYGVASMLMYATEATYFGRRPFFYLMWGGIFDRFPRLKVVLTEVRCDWVPDTLKLLDGIHSAPFFSHAQDTIKLKPSEYFERQCYVAASFMGADESALRHDIGIETMMWGADYPHVEGSWPRSVRSLSRCFDGIPRDEVQMILTDTPAEVYGFDLDLLQPIADRVGPTFEELGAA